MERLYASRKGRREMCSFERTSERHLHRWLTGRREAELRWGDFGVYTCACVRTRIRASIRSRWPSCTLTVVDSLSVSLSDWTRQCPFESTVPPCSRPSLLARDIARVPTLVYFPIKHVHVITGRNRAPRSPHVCFLNPKTSTSKRSPVERIWRIINNLT